MKNLTIEDYKAYEKKLLEYIPTSSQLMGMLYDMNLLPEQVEKIPAKQAVMFRIAFEFEKLESEICLLKQALQQSDMREQAMKNLLLGERK